MAVLWSPQGRDDNAAKAPGEDTKLSRKPAIQVPNDLGAYWMPFTANRQFKAAPRLIAGAKGMYYFMADGREILDGTAGLWCVNAGHCRDEITAAVAAQAAELDYATAFQMGHPKAFELATRLADMAPGDLDHVFYVNSGSEAVETALKIALATQRARGEPGRTRLIGRERGYHGVNFGGMSVGGIGNNRKQFGAGLAGVDHLRHTHDLEHNAFSRGQPLWGVGHGGQRQGVDGHPRLAPRRRSGADHPQGGELEHRPRGSSL